MSFNIKTIALSTAVVLLAVGGAYALTSDEPETPALIQTDTTRQQAPAEPNVQAAEQTDTSGDARPASGNAMASAAKEPVVPHGTTPASGKLTRQALTPPQPATEAEKLQKAAEQEYNRF